MSPKMPARNFAAYKDLGSVRRFAPNMDQPAKMIESIKHEITCGDASSVNC